MHVLKEKIARGISALRNVVRSRSRGPSSDDRDTLEDAHTQHDPEARDERLPHHDLDSLAAAAISNGMGSESAGAGKHVQHDPNSLGGDLISAKTAAEGSGASENIHIFVPHGITTKHDIGKNDKCDMSFYINTGYYPEDGQLRHCWSRGCNFCGLIIQCLREIDRGTAYGFRIDLLDEKNPVVRLRSRDLAVEIYQPLQGMRSICDTFPCTLTAT
jgi:hypothetical protein